MQKLIDFDHVKILINNYEGADLKLRMCMDGNTYMLKFGQKLEPDEKKPLQASYSSSPISEYLGCHVYEIAGTQYRKHFWGRIRDAWLLPAGILLKKEEMCRMKN